MPQVFSISSSISSLFGINAFARCFANTVAFSSSLLAHELNETEKGDKGRGEIAFELYLNEKLGHLSKQDGSKSEPVFRKYCHIFYHDGSSAIGCTSAVKHKIDTGDAQRIKKTPYRIPHALKTVVEDHIKEMLHKGVIKPNISRWSSSIVLVKKKTTDGTTKNRFCVDYRSLNAVMKP
jgi:hypothetical protein